MAKRKQLGIRGARPRSDDEAAFVFAVGMAVRHYRQKNGLSVQETAKAIKLGTLSQTRRELGYSEIPTGDLARYARIFGTTPSEIVRYAEGLGRA